MDGTLLKLWNFTIRLLLQTQLLGEFATGEAYDNFAVYDGGGGGLRVQRYQFLESVGVRLDVLLGELYVVLGQKLCLLVAGPSTGLGVYDYFAFGHGSPFGRLVGGFYHDAG